MAPSASAEPGRRLVGARPGQARVCRIGGARRSSPPPGRASLGSPWECVPHVEAMEVPSADARRQDRGFGAGAFMSASARSFVAHRLLWRFGRASPTERADKPDKPGPGGSRAASAMKGADTASNGRDRPCTDGPASPRRPCGLDEPSQCKRASPKWPVLAVPFVFERPPASTQTPKTSSLGGSKRCGPAALNQRPAREVPEGLLAGRRPFAWRRAAGGTYVHTRRNARARQGRGRAQPDARPRKQDPPRRRTTAPSPQRARTSAGFHKFSCLT